MNELGPQMEEIRHRVESHARRVTLAQLILVLGILTALIATNLSLISSTRQIERQNDDLALILSEIDEVLIAVEATEPVADFWTIVALFEETTVGGPPMEFLGDFDCNPAIVEGIELQFEAFLRSDTGGPFLVRSVQPPVDASQICDAGPSEFPISWEQMNGGDSITEPTLYRLRIDVSTEGFRTTSASTQPFLVYPAGYAATE